MINPAQLQDYVIIPTLNDFGLHSQSAVNLLMMTAAVESNLGYYLHQVGGPALGIFQMEPATHDDIWDSYLIYRKDLERSIDLYFGSTRAAAMVADLSYAALMCRIHYLRVPKPLPHATDIEGLAKYWKDHYNTTKGKGTVEKAIRAYQKFVLM